MSTLMTKARWVAILLLAACTQLLAVTATPTSTALTVTSGGTEVTTVTAGSMVTLAAVVKANGTALTSGQVVFCDASAAYCDDVHMVAVAQITSAGQATYSFRPGVGTHEYSAAFAGFSSNGTQYAASKASVNSLTVTGTFATQTALTDTTAQIGYNFQATVTANGSSTPPQPTGVVSFVDTSAANNPIGSANLSSAVVTPGIASSAIEANISTSPEFTAIGDFNGDGIPDIAVTSLDNNTVTILLGKGDGSFQATGQVLASGGYDPYRIIAADFNHDGKLDLAVTNLYNATPVNGEPLPPGNVVVFLGNGDGTFTQASSITVTGGGTAYQIAAGDFNKDGNLDLAVVTGNGSKSGICILLGNGDGTFTQTPASPYVMGGGELGIADLKGNGNLDIVTSARIYSSASNFTSFLMFLMGNGDGTFTYNPSQNIATTSGGGGLVIADFNGDGIPDIAEADRDEDELAVYLGNGDGTFTEAKGSPIGVGYVINPYALSVADFNGDGIPDLITEDGLGSLWMYLGNGDGTFTQASISPFATGTLADQVMIEDLNGDGIPDIIIPDFAASSVAVDLVNQAETVTATLDDAFPQGLGEHAIQAQYQGNGTYLASNSPTVQVLGLPSVTVTLSAGSITSAQPVTATIAVTGGAGNPTPTGTVVLSCGGYSSGAAALVSGSAIVAIPAGDLAVGTDTLTATYTGDSNYASNAGDTTIAVTTPPQPGLSVSGTSVTLTAGSVVGNTSTIAVTPTGGFTGSVSLTAAITSSPAGAQNLPTLSFGNTTPVSITGSGAGSATLTITTTANTSSNAKNDPSIGKFLSSGGVAFACVFLFLYSNKKRARYLTLLFTIAAIPAALVMSGCGGGSNAETVTTGSFGTTTGSYVVTVTATAGSLTAQYPISVTVQ